MCNLAGDWLDFLNAEEARLLPQDEANASARSRLKSVDAHGLVFKHLQVPLKLLEILHLLQQDYHLEY